MRLYLFNCVLLCLRYLLAWLMYNDFGLKGTQRQYRKVRLPKKTYHVINERATIPCFNCQWCDTLWIAQNVKKTPLRVYVINFDFFDFNVQAHLWLSQIGVYGEHNLPPSCWNRVKVPAKTWCRHVPTSTCPQACLNVSIWVLRNPLGPKESW